MMNKESSEIQHSKSNIKYAGFWSRFVATWIDMILFVVPIGLFVYFISDGALLDFSDFSKSITFAQQGDTLAALQNMPRVSGKWEPVLELIVAAITIVFWKQWAGATPGKKLLKMHVVDAKSFGPITNKQAIIRYIGYIASSLPLGLGFFMVAFHKEKRALHDILADTVVIYKQ